MGTVVVAAERVRRAWSIKKDLLGKKNKIKKTVYNYNINNK